jgi:Rrf2 family protein
MRILKQEDTAILFMTELAKNDGKVTSLSEIAQNHGLSMLYLKKLARLLRQHGLVLSREGIGGGYVLAKKAGNISVLEIISSLYKSDVSIPTEIMGRKTCPILESCLPHTIHVTLTDAVHRGLSNITLADLCIHS